MVKLSRRKTMIGMGLLAGGSGAAFSSAAFASTTTSGADLRVISDGRLTVRGNAADDPEVFDLTDEPGQDIDFADFDVDNLPRATFANTPDSDGTNGNINGDIDLTVGIVLRDSGQFKSILKIDNNTEVDRDVAIHFEDNEGAAGENETYGSDVGDGSNQVSRDTVQGIYQFKADTTGNEEFDTLISPQPETSGVGGTDVDDGNTGANQVTVSQGETLSIALDFDTTGSGVVGEINSAAGRDSENPPFGRGSAKAVDLLNAIVVGVEETST